MKKLLMVLAIAGMSSTVMAAPPGAACLVAPTEVVATYDAGLVEITWVDSTCLGATKYSIDWTVEVYDGANLGTADDCGGEYPMYATVSFTEAAGVQEYSFLAADYAPMYACPGELGSVKIKALTTPVPGGSKKSQNNTFSAPVDVLDITEE